MTWESQGGDFDHGKAYLSVHSESETPWKPSETFRNHSASSLTHSCKKLWNLISKVVQMAKNEETTGAHEDVEFWIPGTEAHHDDSSKRNITAASQAAVFVGVYISCFAFGISVLTVRAAVVTIHTIGAPPRLPEPCTWPRKSNHWTWEPPTDQKPIILTWFTPTAYAETWSFEWLWLTAYGSVTTNVMNFLSSLLLVVSPKAHTICKMRDDDKSKSVSFSPFLKCSANFPSYHGLTAFFESSPKILRDIDRSPLNHFCHYHCDLQQTLVAFDFGRSLAQNCRIIRDVDPTIRTNLSIFYSTS